mmetsp:Transcript_45539/g.81457  ORF Transcript_45539/g.81457 Transcript_45539/m.81457 type:complete len:274 (+) Transcript_45539:2752-3573(+)
MSQDPKRRLGAPPTQTVYLWNILTQQVKDLTIQDGGERVHIIDQQQVLQHTGLEQRQLLLVFLRGVLLTDGHVTNDAVILIVTNALELVEAMIRELGGGEEETGPQDHHGVRYGDGVEILDFHLGNLEGLTVLDILHSHFVNVPILGLDQEEEHVLLLVSRIGDDEQPMVRGHVLATRNDHLEVLVVRAQAFLVDVGSGIVLECNVVLRADQNPRWSICSSRHRDQQVGCPVHRRAPLAQHMVQPQIQFIVHEHLLWFLGLRIVVKITVVNLK